MHKKPTSPKDQTLYIKGNALRSVGLHFFGAAAAAFTFPTKKSE